VKNETSLKEAKVSVDANPTFHQFFTMRSRAQKGNIR